MVKPVAILNKINSFFEYTDAYCHGTVSGGNDMSVSEEDILKRLEQTKTIINDALCDDFNTSATVNELLELINYINKSIKNQNESNPTVMAPAASVNRCYGALMATVEYTKSILNTLGLQLSTIQQQQNVGCSKIFFFL